MASSTCATPCAAPSRYADPDTGKQYKLNEQDRRALFVRPRGWHLDERHVLVDGEPISGSLFDFGLYFFHNAEGAAGARQRPLFLSAQDGEPPRSTPVERRFRPRAERARPAARHHQGHRADRNHPGHLRDGRDPLRAARPLRRPELRPLGLHLQLHQEVRRRPDHAAARPRAGDHDHALHAHLLAAAHQDLPPPQRARHGRHGGAISRSRPIRKPTRRPSRRSAPTRSAKPSDGHDGTWVAHPGPGAGCARNLRPPDAAAQPDRRSSCPTVDATRRRSAATSPKARSPKPACGRISPSAWATSKPGCAASAACRSST